MNDLTKFNLLTASTPDSQSGVSGDSTLDLPSDFKKEISITPTNAASVQKRPLRPIPGGFKEYREWMTNFNAGLRGTPEYYVKYGGYFYLYPNLDASYDFEIEYYKHHAQSTATIEFGSSFTNALNFGTAYFTALFRNKTSYIKVWRPIYFEERQLMIMLNIPQPSIAGV